MRQFDIEPQLIWITKTIPDPAMQDTTLLIQVPPNESWVIQTLLCKFTADATAGNRILTLQLCDESDNILWEDTLTPTITASQDWRIQFATNTEHRKIDSLRNCTAPLPTNLLLPNTKLNIKITGRQSGDAISLATIRFSQSPTDIAGSKTSAFQSSTPKGYTVPPPTGPPSM